jgi:hypothetical protein
VREEDAEAGEEGTKGSGGEDARGRGEVRTEEEEGEVEESGGAAGTKRAKWER